MTGLENADWDLLEATKESLREHMAIAKQLQERVAELEHRLSNKAVIGQYRIIDGGREGTIISSANWPKIVENAGMEGKWMELAFMPIDEGK